MPAPKGNRFWEARSSHGRKPIFANPEELLKACYEYFKWAEDNPLWESRPFSYQGTITIAEFPKMRAMTLDGLCLFLDVDINTWRNYAAREDFFHVTREVECAIRQQKFSGAAADLLNANIIARDLGLSDKNELSGPGGTPLNDSATPTRDLARAVLDIIREAKADPSPSED